MRDSIATMMGMTGFDALEAVRPAEKWLEDTSEITVTTTVADLTRVYAGTQMAVAELEIAHDHEPALALAQSALDLVAQLLAAVQPVTV